MLSTCEPQTGKHGSRSAAGTTLSLKDHGVRGRADQRTLLQELARSRSAPLRRVQQVQVALVAADGAATAAIARQLHVHLDTVRRWRKRFATEDLARLEDRPRLGHVRRYGPEMRLVILATVTSARP
ncbi:helix-turn-helix domain-containing protein [Kitasatospora indigofera]|uniref:helix-turn-helix domain-containing protein n=2 Tax=Kitasatospora indigofera TaxID=67307 RepID=UPI0036A2F916